MLSLDICPEFAKVVLVTTTFLAPLFERIITCPALFSTHPSTTNSLADAPAFTSCPFIAKVGSGSNVVVFNPIPSMYKLYMYASFPARINLLRVAVPSG